MEVPEQMTKGLKASDAQKSSEIDRLKCELQESNKMARQLSEQSSYGVKEGGALLFEKTIQILRSLITSIRTRGVG
ncbi:uncharacterized protein A4U43_C04F31990 [Asparagus officinalis]|uniref:Uncharacterized protein n=1 Tax=Asparagus officinalis TaxID=4686 RepID=A0A5P1FAD3_ASPOF|nr:uncharacterized protein A4U43_C04F31990 [Asparagus officinalis]